MYCRIIFLKILLIWFTLLGKLEVKNNFMKLLKPFIFFLITIYTSPDYKPQELTPEEIFEKVDPSVVRISAYDFDGINVLSGSGVVISPNVVLTNFHIYSGNEDILITHYNESYKVKTILAVDVVKDIVVLETENRSLTPITISSDSVFKIGSQVYAIGSPLGFENSITDGLISGYRKIENSILFQISAPIYPGSSGGAVVNKMGELIGISSSKISNSEINFAIPISEISNISSYCSVDDTICTHKLSRFVKCYNAVISQNWKEAFNNLQKYFEVDSNKYIYKEMKGSLQHLVCEIILNYKLKTNEISDLISIKTWAKDFKYCLNGLYKLKRDGKVIEALNDFITASKIDSTNADYYYLIGLCYEELNSEKSKLYFFKKAYFSGRVSLGLYLWQKGVITTAQLRQ